MQVIMADAVDDMDVMAARTSVVVSSGFSIMAGAAVELHRRKQRKRTAWLKPWITGSPVWGAYSTLLDSKTIGDLIILDAIVIH